MTAAKYPARGIRRTKTGWQVYVQVGGRFMSERHPKTATLAALKARRDEMTVEARRHRKAERANVTAHRGTLAADVAVYLRQVAAMPSIDFRRRDLEAWLQRFGDRPRASITAAEIREQLQEWRVHGPLLRYRRTKDGGEWVRLSRGLSASACNHRRTALLHLYRILDGKAAPNPVRDVPAFTEPPAAPRGRPIALLDAIIDRVTNPAHRARLRVLLWTGMRGNSELGRMSPQHVNLEDRVCYVPTSKGAQRFRLVPLNDAGVSAWQEFIGLNAWGEYDRTVLRSAFTRAARAEMAAQADRGTPAPGLDRIRVYDLRHSVATELLKGGADLADVQDFLGHTTPRMTRRYAPFQRAKLQAAVERLTDWKAGREIAS